MNNNPHNNQGFTNDGCLTEQLMLDYTRNKLTPHERHLVEKHTLDCELCADALEGFSLIRDHGKLDETAFAVNSLVTGKPGKASKHGWWDTRMKVAASVAILVLLGSVYYFQGKIKEQTEDTFAQNFETYPAIEAGKKTAKENEPGKTENAVNSNFAPAEESPVEEPAPGIETKNSASLKNAEQLRTDIHDEKSPAPQAATFASDNEAMDNLSAPVTDELQEDANLYRMEEAGSLAEAAKKQEADKDTKKPVQDKLASTTNTGSNIASEQEAATLSTAPDTEGYTYYGGSNNGASAPSSPSQSQGLTAKQDAYSLLRKKTNENTLALQKNKLRTKSASSVNRKQAKDLPKYEPKETVAKEQPAATIEESVERTNTRSEAKVLSDTVAANSTFDNAMKKYKAGQHQEAVTLFEKTLADDPSNADALFYSSVSYLALNKPDKALTNLNKVLAAKGHSYSDAAKWYKALAYVKKGDKKTAKILLQEIEKGTGAYRQKATQALKDLD